MPRKHERYMKVSQTPKISVLMSVRNGMPFLPQAVKSILSQSYKNFEFIIIDDASADETWEYLKSQKDQRIKLIKNSKNLGLAASLNKGLRLAKGDFIARMDADDISLPNRLKIQLNYLQKHSRVDLCGCWVNLIDEKGETIGEKKYPTESDQVKKAITWYTAVVHPTYMGKRDFFRKMKGYRLNFDYAEDYDLLARAKNKYTISNIPKKLLLWRLQQSRRSRENMAKMDRVVIAIKLESLKRDGLTLMGILALIKKFTMTYCLPFPVKYKLAVLFKYA